MNTIHCQDFLTNNLPAKSVQLIIADPPYFEVKGDFDFTWSSFEAYLQDVRKWAAECRRVLADNGSLFWYGDRRNIAYAQVILDELFEFQNHIYWQKAAKSFTEKYDTLRSFYTRGFERILFYGTKEDTLNLTSCVAPVRDYIRAEIIKSKGAIVFKDINTVLGTATNGGGVASACLSLKKTEPSMITEEFYNKLREWCAPHLAKTYSELGAAELREAYEQTRRYFNNELNLSDHWYFTNDGTVSDLDHPTVKPLDITRAMILTCSRPGDTVLVPFAGSGTECAMAVKEGRKCIGYEIEPKYVAMGNERIQAETQQPRLIM